MNGIIRKNLTLKILLALAGIIVVAFVVLSISVINKQSSLLGSMSEESADMAIDWFTDLPPQSQIAIVWGLAGFVRN